MAIGGLSERLAFILEMDPSNAVTAMRKVGDTADKELGKTDDRLNKIGGRMQVAGAGAVAFAGVAGAALVSFARASEEANLAQVQLQNSIDNSPELAGASADAFNELATAIQSKTAADGDQIVSAMAMLGTFHQTEEQIQGITPLVVDYSRKFGVDLVTAATQVGKALDGNIGTLQRVGINIDEAAYATDRYSAVTSALRDNVGGFAEAEGATFAGSLERLKNQLGDVAEGIGVGVVDAFTNMIGPVESAAEAFTRLDAGTQSTIGKFAAYGTAAVGVAGATSFVIGSLIKMRDNFREAREAVEKFKGGIAQLSAVGGIVALGTAGAAALDHLEDSLISARISMEDLSRASDEELVRSIDTAVGALANFGQSADGLYASLAENGVGTLERYRDALEAAGRSTEDIDAAIQAEAQAQQNATETQVAGTAAIDAATDATDENTGATETNTAALQENIDKVKERAEAIFESLPAELQLREAQIQSRDELASYNEVMNDSASTADQREQAGIDLAQQFIAESEAARNNAETQATAAGRADTATREGVDAQIASLFTLAQNLDPGSPVRVQLEDYINHINRIPTSVTTTVRINPNYGHGTEPIQSGYAPRASGGPVTAGSTYVVGEEGPEVFIPGSSGTIVPNGGAGRPVDGIGGASILIAPQITVNAGPGSDAMAIAQMVKNAFLTLVRTEGTFELRRALGL